MARGWTPEQAASLAPDAASLKAGQGLATPRKWTLLGTDGTLLWGLAQGSGKQPYQVQIDLEEPAFKCSCPSRKFPCKHGLGLLLIHASQPTALASGSRPDWVEEWVAKRAERAAKTEARQQKAAEGKPPDAEAQAKRREKRTANIEQGLEILEGWLADIVRQGIAGLPGLGYKMWDDTARRLIDAQAPGLARRVRELGSAASGRAGWEERVTAQLGRLHLLAAAHRQRASLPPDWQEELDTHVGWTVEQDALKAQPGLARTWFAAAQTMREEDRLVVRTTLVFSPQGEVAKILEFSHASQASASALVCGRWFEAELVFFPGIQSLRAILKTPPRDAEPAALPCIETAEDLLSRHAARLAANSFADDTPALVRMIPHREGERWWLVDQSGLGLPVLEGTPRAWEMLACSGGEPVIICGTWDGFALQPWSVVEEAASLALI